MIIVEPMKRKIVAFLLIPFLLFYTTYVPYAALKYIKYGNVDFHNPLQVILGFLAAALMILPFSILLVVGYFLGFLIYIKLVEKNKIRKFHQFFAMGLVIGCLGYIPFLLFPSSISNWPWSIFYCTLYSSFYWLILFGRLPTSAKS